jgi:hypothetical protein
MPQRIGIVACSAEGAALCYRTICIEGAQFLGPHRHPEVALHNHSLAEYMSCVCPWFDAQATLTQRRAVRIATIVRAPHSGQRSRRGDAEHASFQQPRLGPPSGSLTAAFMVVNGWNM